MWLYSEAIWCGYIVRLYGVVMWLGYMVWLYSEAIWCGYIVRLYGVVI